MDFGSIALKNVEKTKMNDFWTFSAQSSQNPMIFKYAHQMGQYWSTGDGNSVIRKLRSSAIDRRQAHQKRCSISPLHGHLQIPNIQKQTLTSKKKRVQWIRAEIKMDP